LFAGWSLRVKWCQAVSTVRAACLDIGLHYLASTETAQTAAFAAALLCVWLVVFGAGRIPRKTSRLFLAVALFGLHWGLLLLYYIPGPPQNEILTSFSGFLLIYIGILLLRETRWLRTGSEVEVSWPDKLPLALFRATIGGFGTYLVIRRQFHVEYGLSTLALALWGTVLTVLGYLSVWVGITALYRGSPVARRVGAGLGLLLLLYSGWEIGYSVWYAREYWPPYHRFLSVGTHRGTPDPERLLPFEPQPTWPDYARWDALRGRADWPELNRVLRLKVEPELPDVPLALEYGFAALKVLFTLAFLALLHQRPVVRGELESAPPVGDD
jgi:hypothetical protein